MNDLNRNITGTFIVLFNCLHILCCLLIKDGHHHRTYSISRSDGKCLKCFSEAKKLIEYILLINIHCSKFEYVWTNLIKCRGLLDFLVIYQHLTTSSMGVVVAVIVW